MILTSKSHILPGFGPTLGYSLFYIGLIVLIPLSTLVIKTAGMTWDDFIVAVFSPRVVASYRVTLGTALIAALITAVFGSLIAWVLTRYAFPGKRLMDALVDLPFALPTAVVGITLATVYSSSGWIGSRLEAFGIKIAFTPAGIVVAMVFIGLPFVVRTLQPVIEDFDTQVEESALSLGASRWQTIRYVLFPVMVPSILTGFALAFARAIGEYGSIIFIAGNMPMISEITSLLIITKLEQYDYRGATAIASVMLAVSFLLLLTINLLQRWSRKYTEG